MNYFSKFGRVLVVIIEILELIFAIYLKDFILNQTFIIGADNNEIYG